MMPALNVFIYRKPGRYPIRNFQFYLREIEDYTVTPEKERGSIPGFKERIRLTLIGFLLAGLLLTNAAPLEAGNSGYSNSPNGGAGSLPACSTLLSQSFHYYLPLLGGNQVVTTRDEGSLSALAPGTLGARKVTTDTPSYEATVLQSVKTSSLTPPSPDPAGVHFMPDSSTILVADSEVEETPLFVGVNLFEIDSAGRAVDGFAAGEFSEEPTGLSYDPVEQHLFISDDDDRRIYVVDWSQGRPDPLCYIASESFQSSDPEGIVYAEGMGALFIADGNTASVHRLLPGANGYFDGPPPLGDDLHIQFDTKAFGMRDPEGIAYDSVSGHLFLVGKPVQNLLEFTSEGEFVRLIDISAVRAISPAGLTLLPRTDESSDTVLYLVDRGIDNNQQPDENDGRLFKIQVPPISSPVGQP